MTVFREQDLTAARFEGVNLRGAVFANVVLNKEGEHRLYAERDLTALEGGV